MRHFLLLLCPTLCRGLLPAGSTPKPHNLFTPRENRPVVLFDGTCPRCNAWVNFLLDHDEAGTLRYASISSPVGQKLMDHMGLPRDMDAILLVEHDEYFAKSEAFLRILERTTLASYAKMGWFIPQALREAILYANRERFGESDQCFLDELDDRFVSSLPPEGVDQIFVQDPRPILIFDGRCPLCSMWVNLVLDQDVPIRFAAAQTEAGVALKEMTGEPNRDALILIAQDHTFENADAVVEICKRAASPHFRNFAAAGAWLPHPLRTALFEFISKRRHLVLPSAHFCRVSDTTKADRFLLDLVPSAMLPIPAVVPAAR